MGTVLVWVFMAVVVSVAIRGLRDQGLNDRIWREAAARLGLEFVPEVWPLRGRALRGAREAVRVEVTEVGRGKSTGSRLVVESLDVDARLELTRESVFRQIDKLLTGDDVLTGDESFDRAVHVRGEPALALAVLGEDTRARVLALVANRSAEVREQRFTLLLESVDLSTQDLVQDAGDAIELVQELALPKAQVPEALARHARAEARPEVRLRMLEVLTARFPKSAQALQALQESLADSDARVRFFAATHGVGAPVIEALRELVNDSLQDASRRIAALNHLVAAFPDEDHSALLSSLLDRAEPALRQAAAAIVGLRKDRRHFESLRNLALYGSPELQAAGALALGLLGDLRAESTLLGLLLTDAPVAQEAAAHALGELGTLRAVERLRELTPGLTARAAVREAALLAIRRIQARHSVADGGSLSLVGEHGLEGAVSVAESPGAVSVVDPLHEDAPGSVARGPGEEAPSASARPALSVSERLRG